MYNRRQILGGAIIAPSLAIKQLSFGAVAGHLKVEFPLPFAPFDRVQSGNDMTFCDYYIRLLVQNKHRRMEPGDIGLSIMDSRFERTSACLLHFKKSTGKTTFNFLRMGPNAALPARPEWIPLNSIVDPNKSACYLEFDFDGIKESFYAKIRDQLSKTMAQDANMYLIPTVNISFVMYILGDQPQGFLPSIYSGSLPFVKNGKMVEFTGSAAGLDKGWHELFFRTSYEEKADLITHLRRVVDMRQE